MHSPTEDLKQDIFNKLYELEQEQLVEVADVIKVKEEGKKFVRNVAAVFDYRLINQDKIQGFSKSI